MLQFYFFIFQGFPNGNSTNLVELYNPIRNISCSLPNLPEYRGYHNQNGNLACGGEAFIGDDSKTTTRTCVKWNSESGTWIQSDNLLLKRRQGHVSWNTDSGVYLMGGLYTGKTSERVNEDGSVENGFSLKYGTRYNHIMVSTERII